MESLIGALNAPSESSDGSSTLILTLYTLNFVFKITYFDFYYILNYFLSFNLTLLF
jgi:hypothetical protein